MRFVVELVRMFKNCKQDMPAPTPVNNFHEVQEAVSTSLLWHFLAGCTGPFCFLKGTTLYQLN